MHNNFSIYNVDDVSGVCSMLCGKSGYLNMSEEYLRSAIDSEYDEPITFKHDDLTFFAFNLEQIIDTMNFEPSISKEKPEFVILIGDHELNPDTGKKLDEIFKDRKYAVHTHSKIIPIVDRPHTSDVQTTWHVGHTNVPSVVPEHRCVSTTVTRFDVPYLGVDVEDRLFSDPDEYVGQLKKHEKIYVLEEYQQFLLSLEGIESEVL